MIRSLIKLKTSKFQKKGGCSGIGGFTFNFTYTLTHVTKAGYKGSLTS